MVYKQEFTVIQTEILLLPVKWKKLDYTLPELNSIKALFSSKMHFSSIENCWTLFTFAVKRSIDLLGPLLAQRTVF